MKNLARKMFRSPLGVAVRNILGLRPPIFLYSFKSSFLASDLFIWRTDKGLETRFSLSDILGKYYLTESTARFVFYDRQGRFFKEDEFVFVDGNLELVFTPEYLGQADIGTFCVFNLPKRPVHHELNVKNRCYVGYGRNGSFSMVHGNLVAVMIDGLHTSGSQDIVKNIEPSVTARKGFYAYTIQKMFDPKFSNFLLFSNPIDRSIHVNVGGVSESIPPRGCVMLELGDELWNPLRVESDFVFPRPIVISELGEFIDCHHG